MRGTFASATESNIFKQLRGGAQLERASSWAFGFCFGSVSSGLPNKTKTLLTQKDYLALDNSFVARGGNC